jgi:putative ATPase
MECMPPSLKGKEYYLPTNQGNEIKFKERLEAIKKWKKRTYEIKRSYYGK